MDANSHGDTVHEHPLAQALLNRATMVHVQPDDVLIFSNVGDLDPEGDNLEEVKAALGDRTLVFFHGPIDLDQLRDISGGCACCGHHTTEEPHA